MPRINPETVLTALTDLKRRPEFPHLTAQERADAICAAHGDLDDSILQMWINEHGEFFALDFWLLDWAMGKDG